MIKKFFPFWIILISFLITPFLASFLVGYFYVNVIGNQNLNLSVDNALISINQRTFLLVDQINSTFKNTGNNLLLLSDFYGSDLLKNKEKIINFLKQDSAYVSLQYLGLSQNKILEIKNNNSVLFDQTNKDCFEKSLKLNRGEIYISSIDPNGIICYGTPVYLNQQKQGVVVLNFNMSYLFDEVRSLKRDGESFYLIDNQGNYLANPKRFKEIGIGIDYGNFYRDFTAIKPTNINSQTLETTSQIFTFSKIYPTLSSFPLSQGSQKILGENPENNYYWVLISSDEKNQLNYQSKNIKSDYLFFMIWSVSISLLFISLIIVLMLKLHRQKVKKILSKFHE